MWVEDLVDLFVGEFAALVQQFTNGLTGLDCFLSNVSSKLVAYLWADSGDDTNRAVNQSLATFSVCSDAAYAVVNEGFNIF